MLKSGLIVGVLAFLVSVGVGLLIPLCVPCLALFFGVAAGYLAGVFDKPASNEGSARAGALAGVIGGIGAMLGQIVASAVRAFLISPAQAAQIANGLGLPTGSGSTFASSYWAGMIGGTVCFSALDIVFMAALGALGGVIWWQMRGSK